MRRSILFLLIIVFGLLTIPAGRIVAHPGPRERCFPEQPDIPACLEEPFLSYWERQGGLPVLGYPITGAQTEHNLDLQIDLTTQWTERNRLEIHPENLPPYDILLGRMGAERLAQLGRDPLAEQRESGPQPGCLWFEETGRNVCDQAQGQGFKTYWQSHGLELGDPGISFRESLALFGLPLTTPQMETNSSGHTVLTQWFERARFEWHPHNPDQYKVLLGLLGNEVRGGSRLAPPALSIFGGEINRGRVAATAALARDARLSWVRYNGILWSQVEAIQGQRDWSRLAPVEAELKLLAEQGLTPLVVIRGTPTWAQAVPGSSCGPIRREALDDFASFVRDLVQRYSGPPYHVRYWELWNEPDIDYRLVNANSVFGCWGDETDPYYGGGTYAEMLKQVYPAVKQANPQAQVVLGGLLLDCDPTNPPAGQTCRPARFLEGVLRNGGGAAFDVLAYHGYAYWSPERRDWELSHPKWAHRGGVMLGKLDFLREVLRTYGIAKPILINEGGLLCSASCENEALRQDQAGYVVRFYTRAWAHGLLGAVWYTFSGPGWREGGLLDQNQQARPAYSALQFIAGLLQGADYIGPLRNDTVEGYMFRRGITTYQVSWTNDGATVELPLPAGTNAVYTMFGERLALGNSLHVGFEPLILEIRR